jgi:aminoglycoside/choline kinase family phosphotransferase
VNNAEQLVIPETPDALTPEWFTQALRRGGVLSDQSVVGTRSEVLGEGVGFLGDLLRVTLNYDRPEGLPASLIAKMPKLENRSMGELIGAYERENCFYMDMAERMPLSTPRMYYGDFDRDKASEKQEQILRAAERIPRFLTMPMAALARWIAGNKKRRYILLLEDLNDGELGDQVAGATVARCTDVVRVMAKAHAAYWNADLSGEFWLLPLDIDAHMRHGLFMGSLAGFADFFGAQLHGKLKPYLDRLPEQGVAMVRQLALAPTTLLHCDLRLDNLFFRGEQVVVFDWQLVRRGPGIYDIAYFLSSALDENAGRDVTMQVLKTYHSELCQAGVVDYSFDDLLRDYRLALHAVLLTLSTVNQVEMGDGRGVTLMRGWLTRLHARFVELEK